MTITPNLFNPFVECEDGKIAEHIWRIVEMAAPFGSPENLAELEAARRRGEQLVMLVTAPTNKLPI
jgi:hypothetical protein